MMSYTIRAVATHVFLLVLATGCVPPDTKPRTSADGAPSLPPTAVAQAQTLREPENVIPPDTLALDTVPGLTRAQALALKALLETELEKDQFTSAQPGLRPLSPSCYTLEANPAPRPEDNPNPDIHVAFVRPRIIAIEYVTGGDQTVAAATTEVTRVALIRREPWTGKWKGSVNVTRDTIAWRLQASPGQTDWRLCGLPTHDNGYYQDSTSNWVPRPVTPWLPVTVGRVDQALQPEWNSPLASWGTLLALADSVSKLPQSFVVEGNPEPKVPFLLKDICPGEFCSFGDWLACEDVPVRTEAVADAPVAFSLRAGEVFKALTGDIHVLQAGKIIFRRTVHIDQEGTRFTFTPADTLYPLQHEGEGMGTWYFRGKLGGGYYFFGDDTDPVGRHEPGTGEEKYSLVRPRISEWWVKVRNARNREGWVRTRDAKLVYGLGKDDTPPMRCPESER